jgi:hypothetical protein
MAKAMAKPEAVTGSESETEPKAALENGAGLRETGKNEYPNEPYSGAKQRAGGKKGERPRDPS